jgi:hypothetical protein
MPFANPILRVYTWSGALVALVVAYIAVLG